ncbi:aromatic prenyltransferase [Aspergillus undulatus]|uniref:aromatic prenyltransferase n=1 Tax=Aspergillus undulatus TaxID=1810928 RepID=UPI003CCD7A91
MSLTNLFKTTQEMDHKDSTNKEEEEEVWKILTTHIRLSPNQNPSHIAWWTNMSPILGRSLALTGHSGASQYKNLLLVYSTLLPFLGPVPGRTQSNIRWQSCIAGGKGPLDISINYQRSKATFRITIEPIGDEAGTDVDPMNELAPRQLLSRLQNMRIHGDGDGGIDLTWYNQLEHDLVLSNHHVRKHEHQEAISEYAIKTQRLIGLDLYESRPPTVKAYFFPHIRAAATRQDWAVLLFGSVRKLCPDEAFQKSISMIESYITSIRDFLILEKPNVAIDCLAPSRSRVKIYVAMEVSRLKDVYDLWALGGALDPTPEMKKGFEIIRVMWDAVYPNLLPTGKARESMTVHCNWELSPSSPAPVPKIYFLLADDYDKNISSAVIELFRGLGWDEHVKAHTAVEEEAYSMCDIATSTDIYTWLSFAYSNTSGPYITVYSKPIVG